MNVRTGILTRPVVFALAMAGAAADVLAGPSADILVLHSTGRDGSLAIAADREIPKVLAAGLDRPLDYYPEYLDTARFPDPRYRDAFRRFLRLKYQHHRFDLIVSLGSTELDFADQIRRELSPLAPLLFFAYNQPPVRPTNSTGMYSFIDLTRTLRLATALQPDVRNVFVVTGSSDRDRFYEAVAREQFGAFGSLSFTFLSGLTIAELQERLAHVPPRSIVYYVALFRDAAATNFEPIPIVGRLATAANAPLYSWQSSALDRGIVGGALVHNEVVLDALAKVALRLLDGERADMIPTASPDPYVDELDWRALRRWHIDEARVPRGTRLDYRDPDVWTRYRAEIGGTAGVLIVQTAMIGGLLVQRRRRQRAERRALESEARLRATCDRLHDVGKRLIEAQEIERSHIARELHDDLSQQAALLTVRLDLLRSEQYLPDESATLIEDAFESATEISHSLRDLSHRLHPARLRLLGLVPALVGLQRELTTSGTTIHFSHEGVPPGLGFDLTLCFFRVVQEAVQNAVRHGSASHVFVHLSGAADRLSLTIRDNGTGFDVERAWGKGLGLISIAERLESLGGTFAVRSRPGVGSCLEIAAPVPDRSAVVVA